MYLRNLEICSFKYMCFEIDPAQLLNATELALQATLKKAEVKLDPLTDIDKVSALEYVVLFMQKLITNTLMIMIKTDNHNILSICELLL